MSSSTSFSAPQVGSASTTDKPGSNTTQAPRSTPLVIVDPLRPVSSTTIPDVAPPPVPAPSKSPFSWWPKAVHAATPSVSPKSKGKEKEAKVKMTPSQLETIRSLAQAAFNSGNDKLTAHYDTIISNAEVEIPSADVDTVEFSGPKPTLVPSVEEKSWWPAWLPKLSIPVTASLDSKDRGLLQEAITTVKDLPSRAKAEANSVFNGLKNMITDHTIPDSVKKFVEFITDVLVLALCEDTRIWAVMQPAIYLRHGFIPTVVIDMLAYFLTQMIKRIMSPVDQAPGDGIDEETWYSGASAMVSAVYYYIVGSVPDSFPKDLIKGIIGVNAAFALARNFEHFGTYFVNFIKSCVDVVCKLITGKPFFDQSQREVMKDMADLAFAIESKIATRINAQIVIDLGILLDKATKASALAEARAVPKDTTASFDKLVTKARAYLANNASGAQIADPRVQTTVAFVFGEAGVGKTIFLDLVARGYCRAMGYEGSVESLIVPYIRANNFQPDLPANAKVTIYDDFMLVSDPETKLEFANNITAAGSSAPNLRDSPIADKKGTMFDRTTLNLCGENKFEDLPIGTAAAGARRVNGGINCLTLSPDQPYVNSRGWLDVPALLAALKGQTWEHVQYILNKVWICVDHLDQVRNYTQYVTMLAAVSTSRTENANALSELYASVFSGFVPDKTATISTPPTSIQTTVAPVNFAKQERHVHSVPFVEQDAFVDVSELQQQDDDMSPSVEMDIVDQTLQLDDSERNLDLWLSKPGFTTEENNSMLKRVKRCMRISSVSYVFANGAMKANGTYVGPNYFHKMFKPAEAKPTLVDIEVKPAAWTPKVVQAFRGETFHFKGCCARHGMFCYRHGLSWCEAFDEDAVSGNYKTLAHWAVANTDLSPTMASYHMVIADMYSPVETSPLYEAIMGFAYGFVFTIAATILGNIVSRAIMSYYPMTIPFYTKNLGEKDQAYQARGGSFAKSASGPVIPHVNPSPKRAKEQGAGDKPQVAPEPFAWEIDELGRNIVPILTGCTETRKTMACSLGYILGNFAKTVAHVFFPDADYIVVGGTIAQKLPLIRRKSWKDFTDCPTAVQVLCHTVYDLAWVVTPKTWNPFRDISERLIREKDSDMSTFTDCVMVKRKLEDIPLVDGKPVAAILPPSSSHFLGDVVSCEEYTTKQTWIGMYVNAHQPTVEGQCGNFIFTTNTRVGRGNQNVLGHLVAGRQISRQSILCPYTYETHVEAISLLPQGVLSVVMAHSSVKFGPATTELPENLLVVGDLPNGERVYQNTKNSIKYVGEPFRSCLNGLVLEDPRDGKPITLAPVNLVPAPVWKPKDMLVKHKKTAFTPDPEVFAVFNQEMAKVGSNIIKHADPRFYAPLPAHKASKHGVWPLTAVLNGVPELNIPGIDPKKSAGYEPGVNPGHLGRAYWFETKGEGEELTLVPYPWFQEQHDADVAGVMSGVLPEVFVVANGKVELRPEGKAARETDCYGFRWMCLIKAFCLHIPGMFISGGVRNGSAFGVDLNSIEGKEAGEQVLGASHLNGLDANRFDASIGFLAEAASKNHGRYVRQKFPHVSVAASEIPTKLAWLAYVVFGSTVFLNTSGLLSGHPGTTTVGTEISTGIMRTAYAYAVPADSPPYEKAVFSLGYGDDLLAAHNCPSLTNPHIQAIGRRLGVEYTDGMTKEVGAQLPDFTDPRDARMLKRFPWKDSNGTIHWPLDPQATAHIHMFYQAKDIRPKTAQNQNLDAALRQWFSMGRKNFNKVKAVLNEAAVAVGVEPVDLQYVDLYHTWLKNLRGAYPSEAPLVSVKRRVMLSETLANPAPNRWLSDIVDQSVSSGTMGDSSTSQRVNADAVTQVPNQSQVVTKDKLSTNLFATAVSKTTTSSGAIPPTPFPYNPYPRSGVEDVLGRNWQLSDIVWLTSATPLSILGVRKFPEDFANFPTFVDKTEAFAFLRSSEIEFTFSTNGNIFCAGEVGAAWLPFHLYGGAANWRENPVCLPNSDAVFFSASSSEAVVMRRPWPAPTPFYNLIETEPECCLGTLILFTMTPLVFNSATPPTSITISSWAKLVRPEVGGNFVATTASKLFGHPVTRSLGGEKDQSSEVEAVAKAIDGVLTVASQVGSVIGAFDNPNTVAAPTPVYVRQAPGMGTSSGVNTAQNLTINLTTYSDDGKGLFGEASVRPTWDQVLGVPGLLAIVQAPNSAVAGDLIWQSPIDPTVPFTIASAPDAGMLSPLGNFAMNHAKWWGAMHVGFRFRAPSTQKSAFLIVVSPTYTQAGAVPLIQRGDVDKVRVEVVGDTNVGIKLVPGSAFTEFQVRPFAEPHSQRTTPWFVQVYLDQPSSGQTSTPSDTWFTVWTSAAKGMRLADVRSMPTVDTAEYVRSTTPTISAHARELLVQKRKVRLMFGQAVKKSSGGEEDQSSVRDWFGEGFKTASPMGEPARTTLSFSDESRGPIDLIKRSIWYDLGPVTPMIIGFPPTMVQMYIAPWVGWKGGSTTRLLPNGPALDRTLLLANANNPADTLDMSGMAQVNPASGPAEINIPYSSIAGYTETFPARDELVYLRGVRVITMPSSAPALDFGHAWSAQDDFALFHMGCQPWWIKVSSAKQSASAVQQTTPLKPKSLRQGSL